MSNFFITYKKSIFYIVVTVIVLGIVTGLVYKVVNTSKPSVDVQNGQPTDKSQDPSDSKQSWVWNNNDGKSAPVDANSKDGNANPAVVKPGETQPVKPPAGNVPKNEFDKYLTDSKIDKYEVNIGADAKTIVQKYGQPQKKESVSEANFWIYDKFLLETESFKNQDIILSVISLDNSAILGIKKGMAKSEVIKKFGSATSEGTVNADKFGEYKYMGINIGDEYIVYKKKDSNNFDVQLFIYLNPIDKTVKKVRLM